MNHGAPDGELVSAYAREGSESAFHSLVRRHVDLVFATAMRQVGNRGLAEEITQNVFVALARKAPRLTGFESLAGWLHRAAVQESKARIRAELRRLRREISAAEIAALEREGHGPLEALVPLLDEGLLDLREGDRTALILRFIEDRSLREVGQLLGVDEDAARKRVSRALARLTEFFRHRGFLLPNGVGVAAVLTQGTQAAPPALALSSATAGLAAGGAASGVNLLILKAMTLTKTQTAVVCGLLALAPLGWQWQAHSAVLETQKRLVAHLTDREHALADLTTATAANRSAGERAAADAAAAAGRLAALQAQRDGRTPPPKYHWDDGSPFLRVPKEMLQSLTVDSLADRRGRLTPQIQEILQLSPTEADRLQTIVERFVADYQKAQAAVTRRIDPTPADLSGHRLEDTRVFAVGSTAAALNELRERFFGELTSLLGSDRFALFQRGLQYWMPSDSESGGLNSALAVIPYEHRIRFYRPTDPTFWWGISRTGGDMMNLTIDPAEVPGFLREDLRDWIEEAQRLQSQPQP